MYDDWAIWTSGGCNPVDSGGNPCILAGCSGSTPVIGWLLPIRVSGTPLISGWVIIAGGAPVDCKESSVGGGADSVGGGGSPVDWGGIPGGGGAIPICSGGTNEEGIWAAGNELNWVGWVNPISEGLGAIWVVGSGRFLKPGRGATLALDNVLEDDIAVVTGKYEELRGWFNGVGNPISGEPWFMVWLCEGCGMLWYVEASFILAGSTGTGGSGFIGYSLPRCFEVESGIDGWG